MTERIYVEIGNMCNLSCSFCAGTKRPQRQMTAEEFALICEKIKNHTKYIYLHVMGEPLLHPELDSIIKAAKSYSLPVCITTNGTLLEKRGDIILGNSEAVHKVSISLHAPEGNGNFNTEVYLKNAVEFAKSAAEKDIYSIFRLWNQDSDEGKGENSQNCGIEAFLRSAFHTEWQPRPKGFRLKKNIFLEYDGLFTWPSESTADEVNEGFCHGLSGQIAILADGCVVPCCLDADGEIELGNIYRQSLDEILSGKRAVNISKGFSAGKYVEPLCKKCTFARRFKKRST